MTDLPSLQQLKTWRKETEDLLLKYRGDLAELQRKIKESEERIQLIDRLLELEGFTVDKPVADEDEPDSFLGACVEVIRNHGKPIHITTLHSELLSQGIPIPGKGDQANIIARIQRSNGLIIRTGRGMYSLPEFGEPEKKPVRRKKK